jgi:hypothetical protein
MATLLPQFPIARQSPRRHGAQAAAGLSDAASFGVALSKDNGHSGWLGGAFALTAQE